MLSNNRSKKQQSYIDYYETLWANTAGGDFEKSFALFSDYCGYGLEGWDYVTATAGNHYTKTIYAIIHKYHQTYLVNFRDTLACSTGYLLAAVGSRIKNSKKPLCDEGKLAAIFEVIKNHTQFDIENFKTCTWYSPDMLLVSNPSSDKWVSVLVDKVRYDTMDNITLALDSKVFNGFELVSQLILNKYYSELFENRDSATEILVSVDNKISLNKDEIRQLFTLSLEKRNYEVALYLFFRSCGQLCDSDIGYFYNTSEVDKPIYEFARMLEIVIRLISKPIDGDFVSKLIDHMLVLGSRWIKHNVNCKEGTIPEFCKELYKKKEFIQGWDKVERKIQESFKPDYNLAFYFSITVFSPGYIENLLKNHQLDITTACWYAKPCFFEIPNPYQGNCRLPANVYHPSLVENNENDFVKITPLMALIHMAEKVFDGHGWQFRQYWMAAIKLLLAHDPRCVLTKDSKGRDVFDYLQALKRVVISAPWNKGRKEEGAAAEVEKMIEKISKARNKFYMNNLFTFFLATNNNREVSPECNVPKEIYGEVLRKMYQS
jgi:hypothetical protein